ncbi:hypothetical protein [Myceligenerans pegani]|uniref:Uncharacterized protein n=1 Tax=Myceligenerans pegani TaxID=2776917 RepID=A0ABR9N533_9MICO|nr:hypothetical protein [Myceligenerans sp. TRM 65318]MBE1878777.1 hypothetical protein [Myceligenerans sp. TRM 65318]MBE3021048.1 hypothetical protein [Myceligenerans sp. TRM 65318]
MATFAVDSSRQQMAATGVVEAMPEWVETADGKRRPGENQARHEATGLPLWGVEVLYQTESWGRVSTETVKVAVPAMTEPAPGMFRPIVFEGLTANARVDRRNNGLSVSWEAEGIASIDGKQVDATAGGSAAKAAA